MRDRNSRALRAAAAQFRRLAASAEGAADPHVAIGLADALRLLYPASPEASAALEQAIRLVPSDPPRLRAYLEANLAAVRANAAGCQTRTGAPARFSEVCVQRGAEEIDQALALLDADALRRHDAVGWMYERAELLTRAGRLSGAAALQRAVVRRLERGAPGDPRLLPARQRVEQLTKMQTTPVRCHPPDDEHGGKP